MKFFKITTTHTQPEIDYIIMSMTSSEVEYVLSIYKELSMVEYTDENGFECMYAILDGYLINKLSELYSKYGLQFNFEDLTKDVIFDNEIPKKYKNYKTKSVRKNISELITEYKLNWVTKDDILDKILEKGIGSLSKLDFKILNH